MEDVLIIRGRLDKKGRRSLHAVYFAAPCGQRWHISLVDNLFRAAVKVFPGEHLDFLSVSTRAGASYYFPDNYIHLQNSETMAMKGHSAAGEEERVKIDSGKGHAQVQ